MLSGMQLFPISFQLLQDLQATFISQPLWLKQLSKYLCSRMLSPLCLCPSSGIAESHNRFSFQYFVASLYWFRVVTQVCISTNTEQSPFYLELCYQLLSVVFLILAIFTGIRRNLRLVSKCTSLTAKENKHILKYFFPISLVC